ncbi:hypothetical protein GGI07_002856 [Coemansia sp. Benny D115]|nr:hypothetical protein GGI07_002856 [Coemansia sp. Benny D115]
MTSVNKAISPETMLGVLRQLPQMSDTIVDETRHEKVLSYMLLFLDEPQWTEFLLEWKALDILSQSLQNNDYRVSAVAIRFLAQSSSKSPELWATLCRQHPEILTWVTENVDNQHALVRLGCLEFLKLTCNLPLVDVVAMVDGQRLLVRRLLDESYFVVAEACRWLQRLCWDADKSQTRDQWIEAVSQMARREYCRQSAAHKLAVLAATGALLVHSQDPVRLVCINNVMDLDCLLLYLFDSDRLVRDRALDVLEAIVRASQSGPVLSSPTIILERLLDSFYSKSANETFGIVVLRALGVTLRAVLACTALPDGQRQECLLIAKTFLGVLGEFSDEQAKESIVTESEMSDLGVCERACVVARELGARRASCDVARVVREVSNRLRDDTILQSLERLIAHPFVHKWPQLLHIVLESCIGALRLAASGSAATKVDLLQILSGLVANVAIRAPGLKMLLVLAAEMLKNDEQLVGLVPALSTRVVDAEWEVRDTVLEFLASLVTDLGWQKAGQVISPLIPDVRRALADPEEYVRAAAAQALAVVITRAGHNVDDMTIVVIEDTELRQLLGDSEAFVKRAGLDLVYAVAERAINSPDTISDHSWLSCLSHQKLYALVEDTDFEVRVRCARLLSLLTKWLHYSEHSANDNTAFKVVVGQELKADTLLLDMCGDSSRYVRQVCLDSLRWMRARSGVTGDILPGNVSKRQRASTDAGEIGWFVRRLFAVDFERLELSLSTEHLYQEALDTQVERELMRETNDVNNGNNILECY